jgi:hypothetical protein
MNIVDITAWQQSAPEATRAAVAQSAAAATCYWLSRIHSRWERDDLAGIRTFGPATAAVDTWSPDRAAGASPPIFSRRA